MALILGDLSPNDRGAVRAALCDWLPQQAQYVLDAANARIAQETEWNEDDDFATNCESLAAVARLVARLSHQDALSERALSDAIAPDESDTLVPNSDD